MNTRIPAAVALLCCTLLIAGCGNSPPRNFYLLSAAPGETPRGDSPSVGVGPISVPEYLARRNLVYNRQGNRLHVADNDQWAEPLSDGIARVLALNLSSMLDTQDVRMLPWRSARRPDYGVEVTVLVLETDASGANLVAEWLLYRPEGGEPVQRRISNLRRSLAAEVTPADIAPAYSALLGELSERIAAAIRADTGSAQPH